MDLRNASQFVGSAAEGSNAKSSPFSVKKFGVAGSSLRVGMWSSPLRQASMSIGLIPGSSASQHGAVRDVGRLHTAFSASSTPSTLVFVGLKETSFPSSSQRLARSRNR